MVNATSLWLIFILDNIKDALTGMTVMCALSFAGLVFVGLMCNGRFNAAEERAQNFCKKYAKPVLFGFFFFGTGSILCPSTNQMFIIQCVPELINNPTVQNIAGDALTVLQGYLQSLAVGVTSIL